jgi:hypothetical protein
LEQRGEIAFTEAFVPLALDEFEKHRADHRFGEDLEQQPGIALLRRPIQQDAAPLQFRDRLAVARQAFLQHLVIGFRRRGHERCAARLQPVPCGDEIVAQESDMLDALAVIGTQKLVDLAAPRLAFLIEGNADEAVGRGHRLRSQAGIFALDIEIADLAEIEESLVVARPIVHPPAIDIVGQMIDDRHPGPRRMAIDSRQIGEIDVVDRQIVAIAVDKVDNRAADAPYRGQAQLHRPGLRFHRLGAARQHFGIGLVRILHPEPHAAGGGAVFGREIGGGRSGFVIGDEIDLALPPQIDILGAMTGDMHKAHRRENGFQQAALGRAKLDELEAIEANGVLEKIGHNTLQHT